MIHGVGTDIAAVARLAEALRKHGDAFVDRVLSDAEKSELPARDEARARFLARRWAAKEAFAKAFGTGVRGVVSLSAISVRHDAAGAPRLEFSEALARILAERHLRAHLSLSDEADYAVGFVVLEEEPPR